jgi:hypothetical protein
VRVDELDGNVLLIDAGQLALEFVCFLDFANIELRLKGADGRCATAIATTGTVNVVVVKKTEEGEKSPDGKRGKKAMCV